MIRSCCNCFQEYTRSSYRCCLSNIYLCREKPSRSIIRSPSLSNRHFRVEVNYSWVNHCIRLVRRTDQWSNDRWHRVHQCNRQTWILKKEKAKSTYLCRISPLNNNVKPCLLAAWSNVGAWRSSFSWSEGSKRFFCTSSSPLPECQSFEYLLSFCCSSSMHLHSATSQLTQRFIGGWIFESIEKSGALEVIGISQKRRYGTVAEAGKLVKEFFADPFWGDRRRIVRIQ